MEEMISVGDLMKVLYYDCFAGISGDMNLGALVDLGVDVEFLKEELSKINMDDAFHLEVYKGMKNGISGTKVDVVLGDNHAHKMDDHHEHHHHERNYKTIKDIIESSALSSKVKALSIKMFYEVALAEGKVHNKAIEEVHFHEVGAVDSIIDIIGSAICLEVLNVDYIMSSSIQLGGGFVQCQHGKIPVPAPATTEILKGIPVKMGLVEKEMTTPTGAAILKATVDKFTDIHDFVIEKTGYGLGTRTLDIPNVLRVYLGEFIESQEVEHYETCEYDQQIMIETNIDDMNAELFNYIEERLFEQGALDVYKTPIIMKKGRPAIQLSILMKLEQRSAILETIFNESTSGGVREYSVTKHMMTKSYRVVKTLYGDVQVKDYSRNGQVIKSKAEYEVCARLAKEHKVPIQTIYDAVNLEEKSR